MSTFTGTSTYVATEDLRVAVNAAITLQRPLLVKGEPGTGKTVLALEVAKAVKAPAICARIYPPASFHAMRPFNASASVTTGLK